MGVLPGVREVNNPKKIFVHCTATPEGVRFTAADIDRWHRQRGWSGIGYHKVVLLDGTVETGRDPDHDGNVAEHVGAHAYGHNRDSLAVVYVGGVAADDLSPKDTRTPAQKISLLRVVRGWMREFGIDVSGVFGHYEVDSGKACPSFDMNAFRKQLADVEVSRDSNTALHLTADQLPVVGGYYATINIRKLQRKLQVKDDGWMGPKTYSALAKALNHLV